MDLTKITMKTFWFLSISHVNWFEVFFYFFFVARFFNQSVKDRLWHIANTSLTFFTVCCHRDCWYTSGISILYVHAHTPISRLSWMRHWNSSALSLGKHLMWRNYCTPGEMGRVQKDLFLIPLRWALFFSKETTSHLGNCLQVSTIIMVCLVSYRI